MRRFLAVTLIAVLVLALAGCNNGNNKVSKGTENAKVKIGYLPITHSLAVFEEKELLEEQVNGTQIELQKFSSWTDLMDALNAGKIDGASVLIELAMAAKSQGTDLKAVALGHKDGNVILVSNKINSVEDLKGKTFAIPSNQSSHNILLKDTLEKANLTEQDINITQLSPTEMPSSLASGAIDGYCVAEPFGAQAVVQGYGHVLYDSKEIWDNSICCAFVLNNTFINKNKETADTIIDNYFEAGNILSKDNKKTNEIAKKYLGQEEEILNTSLKWIHYDDLKITKESYQELVDKVKKYKINEAPPTYEEFVYENK